MGQKGRSFQCLGPVKGLPLVSASRITTKTMLWKIYRAAVIAVNVWGITMYPRDRSNLDWTACLLCSVAMSIAIFVWLTFVRSSKAIDWSHSLSWTAPFFPMRKYPLRFWSLASVSWMLAGGIAMLRDFILRDGQEAFGGTFFFIGVGIGVALLVWFRIFGRGLKERSSAS
jgi:hypothetical protein